MDAPAPQVIKKEDFLLAKAKQAGTSPSPKVLHRNPMMESIKRYLRYVMYFAVFVMVLVIGIGLFAATGLDKELIKSNLNGQVTSTKGGGIAGATIKLGTLETKTDIEGNFSFSGLDLGQYTMTIVADGFASKEIPVDIGGGIFGLMNNYDLNLDPIGKGFIVGKVQVNNPSYNFADDLILINQTPYQLETDGTFRIEDLETREIRFQYKSANYTDIHKQIDLVAGENSIPETEVLPAGDFVGSIRSYIREDIVTDLKISAEGVSQEQISFEPDNGVFRISDLEIGRKYKVRVTHPNYVDRDYEQTAEQGEASLFNYQLVEAGSVAYLNNIDRYTEVFAAEYDGKNKMQLTDGNFQPYAEYLNNDETVYFLSTRDNVTSKLGGRSLLAYVVSLKGGEPQRITTNKDNFGQIYPNFATKQLVNLTALTQKREDRVIEIMDLKGQNRKQLFEVKEQSEVYGLKISEDGKFITFGILAENTELNGLYRINVATAQTTKLTTKVPIEILDISADGSTILYSARNSETDLTDLFVFTPENGQDTKLKPAYSGSHYQFVGDSSVELVFFDTRNENSNIFNLNLLSKEEKRLTRFSEKEGVEALYQQNGFLLYQTNAGLYIMDFEKPLHAKLVTNDFARYTGFDF